MINSLSVFYSAKVFRKLNEKCNDTETYLDFIRDTENEFKLPERDLYSIDYDELKKYLGYLDNLWNK